MKKVINVGLVKAVFAGENPPNSRNVIWRDLSLVNPIHKYFDSLSGSWEPLSSSDVKIDNETIKKNQDGELYVDQTAFNAVNFYKLNTFPIAGETNVVFSQPNLPSNNYTITVLSYISSGVDIKSGFSFSVKTEFSFVFKPPSRYNVGMLTYLIIMNK
jgi:hypothetical protein